MPDTKVLSQDESQDTKDRLSGLLFDYETINKTDYRGRQAKVTSTKYKPKKTCLMVKPPPLKDVHTMSNWKDTVIPFDLLHKPKDIIRTSPMQIQEKCEKHKDMGLAEAILTRPRLVMTPAVRMDDIEDPGVRSLLVESMYISSTTKAQREVEKPYFSVRAPLPPLPAPANPVTLPKLRPPQVPLEWRMESISWDQNQIRNYCDPTKEFWLRRDPPQCRKCDESAAVEAHRQMKRQMVKRNY